MKGISFGISAGARESLIDASKNIKYEVRKIRAGTANDKIYDSIETMASLVETIARRATQLK